MFNYFKCCLKIHLHPRSKHDAIVATVSGAVSMFKDPPTFKKSIEYLNMKGTVTFMSLAPIKSDRAIFTLSLVALSSFGQMYFNIACNICVPVTFCPVFSGRASLDKPEAPGWKHPLTGWITGLIDGTFVNRTDKIPPPTCDLSDFRSLLLVKD